MLCCCIDAFELRDNQDAVSKMTKRLEQDDKMLVAIHELLRSEVFSSPELTSMCNAFYHVIYGWLNKAFRFFEHIQKDDQVELVRDLTLLVLKN